jgi:uncharacterized protein
MRLDRPAHRARIHALLARNPVVAVLGARQVGKTTLAGDVAAAFEGSSTSFDLEDPRDLAALAEPTLALEPLRGLVVLDEIQHRRDLFPILRVLADRPGTPARFLLLGSASPELAGGSSETLAGRIAFHDLGGLDLEEVGVSNLETLWLRGGFPRSFLAESDAQSDEWRRDFIRTFLHRDVARSGVGLPAAEMERFWAMLAHLHGQTLNASELGRSFGVSHPTARRYVEVLCDAFVVTVLRPWFANVGKRVVKSPKIYVTDSGLLHTLLGLETADELLRHPKLGASWEGFMLGQTIRVLRARPEECFFWATHAGAELDLLVTRGGRRQGFELKRTDTPRLTRSMRVAWETLALDSLDVIHAGTRTFPLAENVRALAAAELGALDRLREP